MMSIHQHGLEEKMCSLSTARQVFPYSVECKNVELNIWAALDQATANCGDATPIVIFRRNRSATYAVVPWDHFLQPQAHPPQR